MGRLFIVKSIRAIEKGMEHTARTFTTLKAENLTCVEKHTHAVTHMNVFTRTCVHIKEELVF